MADISKLLSANNISLEKQATDIFSAQVDEFGRMQIGKKLGNIGKPSESVDNVTPGALATNLRNNGFQSSLYASELIKYAPKHRFLFKVEFTFSPAYQKTGSDARKVFEYSVKQIDRPSITFDYEEVNFYNYRTQVLKRINYQPLNMEFYDDQQNEVLSFFEEYRRAHSPISRMKTLNTPSSFSPQNLQEQGMNFTNPNDRNTGNYYAASSGHLAYRDDASGVQEMVYLEKLKIYQIFQHGMKTNVFTFINPKIQAFDLDDVNAEGGEGNVMRATFVYDSLTVDMVSTSQAGVKNWSTFDLNAGGESAGPAVPSPTAGPEKPPGPLTNLAIGIGKKLAGTVANTAISSVVNSVKLPSRIPGIEATTKRIGQNILSSAVSGRVNQIFSKSSPGIAVDSTGATPSKVQSSGKPEI
jgi:hypothetical protein